MSAVARVTAFIYLGQSQNILHDALLSRGMLSDAACAMLFALLLQFTHKWRVATILLYAFYSFVPAANIVNIGVNFSNLSIGDTRFLYEGTFLWKTIISINMMQLWLLFIVTLFSTRFLLSYPLTHLLVRPTSFPIYALFSCQIWLPLDVEKPFWQQYNIFEENFVTLLTIDKNGSFSNSIAIQKEYARFMKQDFSGEPISPTVTDHANKPNILIITIEGLSEQFLQDGFMPNLKELGDSYIHYPNFVFHQRFTENGLYSITCGDMPTLYRQVRILKANQRGIPTGIYVGKDNSPNKWSLIANRGTSFACLPKVLADNGYQTAFFQASDLRFTNKYGFMKNAGMQLLYSQQSLAKLYPFNVQDEAFRGNSFGMPDGIFFPRVVAELGKMNMSGKPWFATVMTTSTHYPFFVASEDKGKFKNETVAAFHSADTALGTMITALNASGLLKNTLLIITGDESGAVIKNNSVEGMMAGNWGTLIVKTPDNIRYTSEDYFVQSDLMASILDYTGLASEARMGRSIFRKYSEFRPIMFANIRTDRWFSWYSPNKIIACANYFKLCQDLKLHGSLFNGTLEQAPFDPEVISIYIQVARKSDFVNISQVSRH